MAIPKVYRSTDAAAPVMNRAVAGSAVAVLRACLVDGYGTQSPAGWTEPFTAATKAVFRNADGFDVRVDDALTGSTARFLLQAFRTMSDVDTGSDGTTVVNGFRSPAQSAADASWVLVATPSAFYASATDNLTEGYAGMLCGSGSGDSLTAADAYRYFVLGISGTNANSPSEALIQGNYGGWGSNVVNTGLCFGRNHSGLTGPAPAGLLRPFIPTAVTPVGGSNYPAYPAANSATAAALPAMALQGSGETAVIRARLPGLYLPLFNVGSLAIGDVVSGIGRPGSEMVVLRSGSGITISYGGLLVETALDWGD